jgi:transcription antitermination factor NusG
MKTRGRRSKKPSSHTHRVARSYAANMGKRLVQIEDKDRLLAPIIEVPEKGKPVDLLWHVGTTLPRQERKAHGGLTEFGAVVFAPMQVRWAHYARDKRAVERALFPGYVFIGLRPGQGLQASQEERQRMGVSDILYLTESQSRALASFLFQIACRQAEGEFDDDGTVKGREAGAEVPLFAAGEQVEIMQGAFARFMATVVSATARTAKIELPMFGRVAQMDVPLEDLQRVS